MFFPYRTDAPLYYFPFVTLGLIIVNVLVFLTLFANPPREVQEYVLQYGVGLKPHQWITSNFLHVGLFHLLGNMLFLWTFGLVVEGKVGPVVFLPLYLGIGAVQCALEQVLLSNYAGGGGSVGASAILFGLMAIALVWAPRNHVSVGVLYFSRTVFFEIPILVYCGLLILWELCLVGLTGLTISSAALHAMGAVIGLAVGLAFLKFGWVDCEGWDLFAVLAGEEGKAGRASRRGR